MPVPRRQRVAAYAVIVRDERILLSRLSPRISSSELWTLPGGGLDHGEDPRDAVVREIREETGLEATVGEQARVYSAHLPNSRRDGRHSDYHAVRIVYDAWVPPDAPPPRVVEVAGSTVDAAWHDLAAVVEGVVPTTPMVLQALTDWSPFRMQRVGVYALIRRGTGDDEEVLLTRLSPAGYHTGSWSLPGGGVDHGERPAAALVREVEEECGVVATAGRLLTVYDDHFSGTAPSGRYEDFHAISLVFEATVPSGPGDPEPRVVEVGGTTDAVEWVPVAELRAGSGSRPVLEVVERAMEAARKRA